MIDLSKLIKKGVETFYREITGQINFCKFIGFVSLVILFNASSAAQIDGGGEDLGLLAYEDRGEVSDTLLVSAEGEQTVYEDAKLVKLPIEGDIRDEWENVELKPLISNVNPFFYSQDHGPGLLYPPKFQIDVSDKETGHYALFLWGCDRDGSPSSCTWLKPHKFEKTGSAGDSSGSSSSSTGSISTSVVSIATPDFVREGDRARFEALTANIPGEIQSYNWEISRNGETRLESTGQTVDFNIERQTEFNPLTVNLEVVTDQDTYETETEQWVALSKPEGAGFLNSPHRGGYHGPENTIMTFEQARKSGADSVEFDVKKTGDDQYVVRHDRSTSRTTNTDKIVPKTSLDELTDINVKKVHEVRDYHQLEKDEEESSRATIPSLNETLDFFQSTDIIIRMELKGRIKGSESSGREIYKRVKDRGLEDQVIFMSSRGNCDTVELSGINCRWNALEGINALTDNEAETAMLWYKRNKPWEVDYNDIQDSATSDPIGIGTSALTQAVTVTLNEALDYAESQNMDIIVPRDSYHYPESSIKHSMMYRSEFVENARDRDLEYAFMGFRHTSDEYTKKKQMARCGVKWISTNRPEFLMQNTSKWTEESYQYDPTACEVPDDDRVDAVDVGSTVADEGEDFVDYVGDTATAPIEAGQEGIEGVQDWTGEMIDDPSLGTVGDGVQGVGEYGGDLTSGAVDHVSSGVGGALDGTQDVVETSYDSATNFARDPAGYTEDSVDSAVEATKGAYCDNLGWGC